MNNKLISLELTKEEYRIILESLLFSCSLDVSAKWYEEETIKARDIAIKLRSKYPQVLTENTKVIISTGGISNEFDDSHTKELLEYFPEIIENI